MKECLITILVIAFIAITGWVVYDSRAGENEALKEANGVIAELQSRVKELEEASSANVDPAAQLNEAAILGLTERPGWQLQNIMERGGDGSVFYQMEGSTRKDPGVTTVGPHGFSWRSTTEDALASANWRRNGIPLSTQTQPQQAPSSSQASPSASVPREPGLMAPVD